MSFLQSTPQKTVQPGWGNHQTSVIEAPKQSQYKTHSEEEDNENDIFEDHKNGGPSNPGNCEPPCGQVVPASTRNTSDVYSAPSDEHLASNHGLPIMSLGPNTDKFLDTHKLSDDIIPKLFQMTLTVRNSRWARVLQEDGWNMNAQMATQLSQALLDDARLSSGITCMPSRFICETANVVVGVPSRSWMSIMVQSLRLAFELALIIVIVLT
jgi:hypothetical protein